VSARGTATGLTLVLLLGFPSSARSDDDRKPTARLDVQRGEASACPDSAALADAVTGRLGYDPFVAAAGDLRISVQFTSSAAGLSAHVEAFDGAGGPRGEKTIASRRADCGEVAQAVTLTIALLLDPRSGLVPRRAPSRPEPDPLAPVADEMPRPAPPPVPAASQAFVPRARAGIVGTVGAEPGPSLAARVAFGFARPRWSVDAELRADIPREATTADKQASSGLLLGALVPCLRAGQLGVCAVVAVGALRSEVSSSSPPSATSVHVAAGPRAALTLPFHSTICPSLICQLTSIYRLRTSTCRTSH